MRAQRFEPRRLDVEAFAAHGAALEGEWPARNLQRLLDFAHPEAAPESFSPVAWQASGELRKPRGSDAQTWLNLDVQAHLPLVCQRCLGPIATAIEVKTAIRFVRGDDAAAQLDAESEEDVLALARSLDLQTLAEDELLLAMPLVPRHECCPAATAGHLSQEALSTDDAPHPFAALAAWKRGSPSSA